MAKLSRSLTLIVPLGLLAACGHSPPTRFLTLDAVAPLRAPVAAYAGAPLQVQAVHLPPTFDRPDVVREVAPQTLKLDDFARWGATPGELSRTALTADLAARLPRGAVIYPAAPAPATTLGIVVDVLGFSSGPAGAVLDASWTVVSPVGGKRAVLAHHTERLVSNVMSSGAEGVALQLSALLASLSDHIVADLAPAQ